jgi:hypothetical protein
MTCYSLIIAPALLLYSCSENSSKTAETGSSNQLSAADLSVPSNLNVYEKASAAGLFESRNADFLASKSSTLDSANQETCAGKARNSVEVSALGDTLTVDSRIDLTECYKEEILKTHPGAVVNYSTAYLSLYMQMTCKGRDLSEFQGRKLGDLLLNLIFTCEENQYLVNSKTLVEGTMDSMGSRLDLASSTIYAYSMPGNHACSIRRSGANFVGADDCVEIRSESRAGMEPRRLYAKYVHKSLEWAESNQNTWYASGAMDISINNWTGHVVFHGARDEPTYSLASGTETINGSLTLPR